MKLFFIRRFNDLDHIAPIIYKTALSDPSETVYVFSQNPLFNIKDDFRLKYLRNTFRNVHVDFIYHSYKPTVLHRLTAALLTHSGFQKDNFSNQLRKGQFGLLVLNLFVLLFKKTIFNRLYEKKLKIMLYDTTWAENFLKKYAATVVIFDHISMKQYVTDPLFMAAEQLNIPTVAVPHGLSLFSRGFSKDFLHNDNIYEKTFKSRIQYMVVPHQRAAALCVQEGIHEKKIHVLGSARYCKEWERILRSMISSEKLPFEHNGKLNVLYLERGADRHGKHKKRIKETLKLISELNYVNFIIKPPTRSNRLHFKSGFENAYIAGQENSINLIRWADVVIGTVTSILVEVFIQKKILLYPKYFHDDTMIFEETGTCWTVNNDRQLEEALNKLHLEPSYRPYAQSNTEELLTEIVYADKKVRDVLEGYSAFINQVRQHRA